jgi:hypothetical protein
MFAVGDRRGELLKNVLMICVFNCGLSSPSACPVSGQTVRRALVIDAEQMQSCCVQVVDGDGGVFFIDNITAPVVRLAITRAPFTLSLLHSFTGSACMRL